MWKKESVIGVTWGVLLLSVLLVLAGCESIQQIAEMNEPTGELTPDDTKQPIIPIIDEPSQITANDALAPVDQENKKPTVTQPTDSDVVKTITVNETQRVSLNIKVTDPDGDPLEITYGSPLNQNGEWLTKEGDAGEYVALVKVSDGSSAVEKKVRIVVNALNRAPVLGKIQEVVVNEGELVELEPLAVDPDGDEITISYSGFMNTATYQTTHQDAGEYTVTVTASDGKLYDEQNVRVVVKNVNRPPEVFPVVDTILTEGDTAQLKVAAADPDRDPVRFTFEAPFNEAGVWQTSEGDAGTYKVKVTASDGTASVETVALVIVKARNKLPVLSKIPDQTVNEGEELSFTVTAIDEDNDPIEISIDNLPLGARFNDNTQKFTWKPDFDVVSSDEGNREFMTTIKADDGKETVTQDVLLVVNHVNQAPSVVIE